MFVETLTESSRFLKVILMAVLLTFLSATVRAQVHGASEPDTGEGFTDDFNVIVGDRPHMENLFQMDQSFNAGHAELAPWSDSYWPVYKGLIAYRYADSRTPQSGAWSDYYRAFQSHPSENYVTSRQQDLLSPAEKYDLLMGDSKWSLTHYMWNRGLASMREFGVVAGWTGICHGWSGASQVGIPKPMRAVRVQSSVSGLPITFYPFDIQALVSFLWSGYSAQDTFTGRRCRSGVPAGVARATDPACNDVNPKTWHLSVVNRMGRYGQSFIMDVSSSAEVWNYVLDRYHIRYFNPQTLEVTPQIDDAVVKIEDFTTDPYSSYRSERAKYVVGVQMDVFYPGAIRPHRGVPERQYLEWKRYVYDLELDGTYSVVGGEWNGREHPDFIWMFPEDRNPFLNPNSVEAVSADEETFPLPDPGSVQLAHQSSPKGRLVESVVYRILHRSLTPEQ